VGCRFHLLIDVLEVQSAKRKRPTKIVLNRPADATRGGRRPGLASSAAAVLVQAWIDEAVEALSYMEFTCALDVVEAYPDGIGNRKLGRLLGVGKEEARRLVIEAKDSEDYALARWRRRKKREQADGVSVVEDNDLVYLDDDGEDESCE
jgi:hypothetical protein